MDMFNKIRVPKFDKLATKTANCLLGFECETEGDVNSPVIENQSEKDKNDIISALEEMGAKNKQQKINSMSKGSYFLIFIIALLLMGFSLGNNEEE